jgi:hypothetical protein
LSHHEFLINQVGATSSKEVKWRRRQAAVAPKSTIHIPDDLIKEVSALLPAKCFIQLKCASKPFNSFISKPTFIQMHFNQASQNAMLVHTKKDFRNLYAKSLVSIVVPMLDKPSIIVTLTKNLYYQLNDKDKEYQYVIGCATDCFACFFLLRIIISGGYVFRTRPRGHYQIN